MSKLLSLIGNSLKNPAILYMLSRYGTYAIQFVNSIFIAVYMGPYYLGIWGFINLIISYLAQINLGIPHAINVMVSVKKTDHTYSQRVIGNGVSMIIGLSLLIVLFFALLILFGVNLGEKYQFSQYVIPVTILAILTHFNSLFANIFRIYGKVFAIGLNQSLFPLITLITIFFFRGESLLKAILIANIVSFLISFILYIIQRPISLCPRLDCREVASIQKKAWHLFVYNASFYLILFSTKSFIGAAYSVEEFGYITFSYQLANAIFLLLNSISYLVFPKLLNRFANGTNEQIKTLLDEVRAAYITTSHLLVHLVIMLFPLFLLFFPQYAPSKSFFILLALTMVLYTNSFGYQGMLMARNCERRLGQIAFSALSFNVLLCYLMIQVLKVPFVWSILPTMVTYFLYVLIIGIMGKRHLGYRVGFIGSLLEQFPLSMILPFITSVVFVYVNASNWMYAISLLLFIILNRKDIKKIFEVVERIIRNPNIINI